MADTYQKEVESNAKIVQAIRDALKRKIELRNDEHQKAMDALHLKNVPQYRGHMDNVDTLAFDINVLNQYLKAGD